MSIEKAILNWDGKSSSDIGGIYHRHRNDDLLAKTLVELSRKPELQKGTTWILKCYFENGQRMELKEIAALMRLLPKLEHWEAKLHILQCLPYMKIGKTEKKTLDVFLRTCISDANKFVRAWAYNGLYELACQYPEYKPEVAQFFEMAMKDEAASVKARIRNIMKAGF